MHPIEATKIGRYTWTSTWSSGLELGMEFTLEFSPGVHPGVPLGPMAGHSPFFSRDFHAIQSGI
jgi:hypothetical protein